jgi:hypothetical protein
MATPAPPRRRLLAYLVAAVVVVSLLIGAADLLAPSGTVPSLPTVTVAANLSLASSPGVPSIPPDYFGINVRPDLPVAQAPGGSLNHTPIRTVRWPGGSIADRLDALHGVLYNDSGQSTIPPSNLSEFVTWCESYNCSAILQLPTEIDEPTVAAAEVSYVTQELRFEPAYWELGDEPSIWTHFGVPWSNWSLGQHLNATPSTYARTVQSYVAAIHGADAAARVLGIGGIGQGDSGEPGWLAAVAALNGPNLSGYAIHVYPAGGLTSSAGGLASFYSTLQGGASIPSRIAADRAALSHACPTCGNVPILITELGSGNGTTPYQSAMGGFPEVPYMAAELIQGIEANVSSAEMFAYEAEYNGSFETPGSSVLHPVASLYSTIVDGLTLNGSRTGVHLVTVTPDLPGIFALATSSPSDPALALLIVDSSVDAAALRIELPVNSTPWAWTLPWDGSEALPPAGELQQLAQGSIVTLSPGSLELIAFANMSSLTEQGPEPASGWRSVATGAQAPLTVTSVSVPLMPGMRRILWTTTSSASLTCPAWIFTMRSKGPVTASTSTTWGT